MHDVFEHPETCEECDYDLRSHALGEFCPECGERVVARRRMLPARISRLELHLVLLTMTEVIAGMALMNRMSEPLAASSIPIAVLLTIFLGIRSKRILPPLLLAIMVVIGYVVLSGVGG